MVVSSIKSLAMAVFALSAISAFPVREKLKREDSSTARSQYWDAVESGPIEPKVMIVSMFGNESGPWEKNLELSQNITVPGLSPLFPHVQCVSNFTICQVTTGEGEINAASTLSALTLSSLFGLGETYFLVAGIAGINPYMGSIGMVTFAKYAVQAGLAYQVDSRQMSGNWSTGYYGFHTDGPGEYPGTIYGTEVFELNGVLRNRALSLAQGIELSNGTEGNIAFRSLYDYEPANQPPAAIGCDTLTSDTYWYGSDLGEAFGNFSSLITNGTAQYCTTQQEDNATLESMLRAAKFGLMDFSRVVILRTAADYERPPPKYESDVVDFFNNVSQGGSYVAVENLFRAGMPFVEDVINNWDLYYKINYFKENEYVGDYFNTLKSASFQNFGSPYTE